MNDINRERVIVITGDSAISAEQVRQMLADKVPDHDYEILTNREAGERGLLHEHFGDPVGLLPGPVPYPRKPINHRPRPHPERDAWNAAVDAKKAAKRVTKVEPVGAERKAP